MGVWIIVCIQKPSHHFLQTLRPLCMFKIVFRDSSLYPKQSSLFCLLWLISASFTKPLVWKTWIWRQIMMSQTQRTPNTNNTRRHWMKSPMKMFCVRHWTLRKRTINYNSFQKFIRILNNLLNSKTQYAGHFLQPYRTTSFCTVILFETLPSKKVLIKPHALQKVA